MKMFLPISILFCGFILIISSCKKDSTTSASISWTDGSKTYSATSSVLYTDTSGAIILAGAQLSPTAAITIDFIPDSSGTFTFGSFTGHTAIGEINYTTNAVSSSSGTATLKISGNTISGSFSFSGMDSNGATHTITAGTFTDIPKR